MVRILDSLSMLLEGSVVDDARKRKVVTYRSPCAAVEAVADRVLLCLDRTVCTALGDGGTLRIVERVGKRTVWCLSSFSHPPGGPLTFSRDRKSMRV